MLTQIPHIFQNERILEAALSFKTLKQIKMELALL